MIKYSTVSYHTGTRYSRLYHRTVSTQNDSTLDYHFIRSSSNDLWDAHKMIRQMSRILSRFTRLTLHLRPSYHRFISAGHTMDVIPPCGNHSLSNLAVSITDWKAGIDPNNYTSGRRLRHDKVQRELRFIRINFGALCRRVLELCPGADSIAKCQKIEGAFNRVLIFTLNNDKRVVARLPFALAGPSRLTTASEVATIKYCELE